MADQPRKILMCSCEDTMSLSASTVSKAYPGAEISTYRHLCRTEMERFKTALQDGTAVMVGCTQEASRFSEAAGEHTASLDFVNVRETAGWSNEGAEAGPKMAALFAAATEPAPDFPFFNLSSEGVVLIYGRDESAIEAGKLLAGELDVTVLLDKPGSLMPPGTIAFPVAQGTIRNAAGYLGTFELSVDDYAQARPSSRDALAFESARDGAKSRCDLILDLSGGAPLFPAHDLRDGYLRADPGDPAAVLRAVLKARDLVGSFDKPRYINFTADLCTHSRSNIVGCHRCLDLCPTGAITPDRDHVVIDPGICAGCGQCAAACPTGAAAYALPPVDALIHKLRAMLTAYHQAGGLNPILLLHDDSHGTPLIEALARYGDGLPSNVIPLAVNELTQIGLETIAAAFAYGLSDLRFLLRAHPRHDTEGLHKTIALAKAILGGLGFDGERVSTIEADDPDALGTALREIIADPAVPQPATFRTVGRKREVLRFTLGELHRVAPTPVDVIALPQGAPLGGVSVNVDGCTLCLSCVSACPTGALSDDPDRPMLRFAEDACVQCGLCQATCPEKVIELVPQIDFRAATALTRTIKEEEPALCIRCHKPFGVKSTIDRVAAKLEGRHWMYPSAHKRAEAIRMCADCRVIAMSEEGFDPFAGIPERPAPRTTDDYLRARDQGPKN